MIKDCVEIATEDEPLRSLLETRVVLVRQVYETTNREQAPYAYKEQTNVGILAGAASRIGWAALEECAVKRIIASTEHPGRVDLSLWNDKGQKFLLEAKLTVRSVATLKNRLKIVVANAIDDVEKLQYPEAKSYAVVFVIPRFDKSADDHTVKEGIESTIDLCRKQAPDFLAHVFPGCVTRKGSDHMDKDQCAYGIIVLGFCR